MSVIRNEYCDQSRLIWDASRWKTVSDQMKMVANWLHLSRLLPRRIFETHNRVLDLQAALEVTQSELRTLSLDLDRSIDHLFEQMHELTAVQFELRAKVSSKSSRRAPHRAERYLPADPKPFAQILSGAKAEFPRVYPLWRQRLDATKEAFVKTKIGNAAHAADPRSRLFRSLVETYATGRVLDVGCGVFGRPYYLMSYSAELIFGLDPLAPFEPPDFEHVRGISEYLPWRDESFSTIISATSLDHCMSLDRSLAEMRRVLRPGGRLLLWIDSVPGAARYAPNDPKFEPADRYHLFHFDTIWFEPMLTEHLQIVDRMELRKREFNRVMYVLTTPDSQSTLRNQRAINPASAPKTPIAPPLSLIPLEVAELSDESSM
jgi:SAM-dependent methyltransferase